ncbi:MAG: methylmalonyl-CoA mutase family protein [Rhodospirillales bacterium]
MTDQQVKFAEGFAMPTYEQWVGEVEKALKGAPFDKRMYTKTYEGVTLKPIYTRQDWPPTGDPSGFPASMPFTRGSRAAGNRVNDWDMRQAYNYPDPSRCNDIILHELDRGVTSLHIVLDAAAKAGLDPDANGADTLVGANGVVITSLDDLDRLLTGVLPELITISLDAGAQFIAAAALLDALWRRRGIAAAAAKGAFNADPLGVLAGSGSLPVAPDVALAQMADLAAYTVKTWPAVTAVAVNTSPYHDAGANESQDLAVSMATALAYLKAMTGAGLAVDDACRQILFTFPVTCDQFLGIAKLRAARKMWARIAEACGASEPARAMRLDAVTASRMFSKRDPWVNMLRTTVACFAAAVGGADSITVRPFDAAIGIGTELGRRVARNTQIVLAEESNLAKVIDPAGGSWYVESRTDELAKVAWAEFQAIEKAGGILAGIQDGSIAKKIAASWKQREGALAKRRDPVTGVSEFPNVLEAPVDVEQPDMLAIWRAAADRVKATRAPSGIVDPIKASGAGGVASAAATAAAGGATIGQIAGVLGGATTTVEALPQHRVAEQFEDLRDAADAYMVKTGIRPKIFLANLGPVAQHTGRATFAKNFFEVAGIEAIGNAGFSDAAGCVEAFKDSGAQVAVLCSSDSIYEQLAESTAHALKAAGCTHLFLAGAPGDKKDLYTASGINDFIFMGGDVLQTNRSVLAHLGVI